MTDPAVASPGAASNSRLAPSRLAILFEFPTLNGGERSMLAALDALRRLSDGGQDRSLDFLAMAPAAGPLATALTAAGIAHIPFECRDQAGKRRAPAELLLELDSLVRAQGIELLHANSLSMARLTGAAAVRLPIPTTGHLRDMVRLSAAAVADLNRNRRLIAVSHATRQFHVGQGVASDRLTTLYNGVDLERFAPRPMTGWLKRELGLPVEAFLIATIGQIGLRKGQDTLAAAAALIGPVTPQAHFLIIGERYSEKDESVDYERRIFESFHSAGLNDRVHRLGYRHDMERVLPEIDLIVHPARQEPLGRVLLEAAACGKPIVATDVGGTSEILRDAANARLVAPGMPRQLADAVLELIRQRSLRATFGAAARRAVEERFAIGIASRKLKDFWLEILSKSAGSAAN
ncbi:MAG: glycosyltransferase family 4 protein [Planctomycetaceae bacterium]|nr:glycosyltransferase family 4 protein [Planctomycetaceae bacterium]